MMKRNSMLYTGAFFYAPLVQERNSNCKFNYVLLLRLRRLPSLTWISNWQTWKLLPSWACEYEPALSLYSNHNSYHYSHCQSQQQRQALLRPCLCSMNDSVAAGTHYAAVFYSMVFARASYFHFPAAWHDIVGFYSHIYRYFHFSRGPLLQPHSFSYDVGP